MVERHVLASPRDRRAESWRTFGATPDLVEKLGDLANEVPWPIGFQTLEEPVFLGGVSAEDVLGAENYHGLGFAHSVVRSCHLFSLSGVLGPRRTSAGRWRVMTHTLVLDRETLEAVAGYPEGLLRIERSRAKGSTGTPEWFRHFVTRRFLEPEELEPLPLDDLPPEAFDEERVAAVTELQSSLSRAGLMSDELISWLTMIHEALADAFGSADPRAHVVLRGQGEVERRLAHMAWLTLPRRDRVRVTFGTHVRPVGRLPHLSVIARNEMPHSPPPDWIVLDGIRTFESQEFRGRKVWIGWELDGSPQAYNEPQAIPNLEIQNLSILSGGDARYVATLPEYLDWLQVFRNSPDLQTVAKGVSLASSRGLEREAVVAALASAAVSAAVRVLARKPPKEVAAALLDAVDGHGLEHGSSGADLRARIVAAVLDLLEGESDNVALSLGGAVLCLGSLAGRGGLTFDDLAPLSGPRNAMAQQLVREISGARLLLKATAAAWAAAEMERTQAQELIELALEGRQASELKQIVDFPEAPVETARLFAWWILVLRAASQSELSSARAAEALKVAIIPFLLDEPRQGKALADEPLLCEMCLQVVAPEHRGALLQSLNPPTDFLADLLTRMDLREWIPALIEARGDPLELDQHLSRKGIAPLDRIRLLMAPDRRGHSDRDRAYRLAAKLVRESSRTATQGVAQEILTSRTATPPGRMGTGERLLVSSALEILAGSGWLDGREALSVAELARKVPGSALAWMVLCYRGWDRPGPEERQALLAFGEVVAEEARMRLPGAIENLLRAAWIQLQTIGRPALLENGTSLPPRLLPQLLAATPPLPLYLVVRRRLCRVELSQLDPNSAAGLWRTAPAVAKRLELARPERSDRPVGTLARIRSIFRRGQRQDMRGER